MAVAISHAMRRFPLTSPDGQLSFHYTDQIRGSAPSKPAAPRAPSSGGESALSRSMRYADSWLYSSVHLRASDGGGGGGGVVVATPALSLCNCGDSTGGGAAKQANGRPQTLARSSVFRCRKCNGARLDAASIKYGTVRCYSGVVPTELDVVSPLRAGTVRVLSCSSPRPSILPSNVDPYNLMRKSRMGSIEQKPTPLRARSKSPKLQTSDNHTPKVPHRLPPPPPEEPKITLCSARRSILECDLNPYELISRNSTTDTGITLLNGQRIRVHPKITDTSKLNDDCPTTTTTTRQNINRSTQPAPPRKPTKTDSFTNLSKEHASSECLNSSSTFKSILKKPTEPRSASGSGNNTSNTNSAIAYKTSGCSQSDSQQSLQLVKSPANRVPAAQRSTPKHECASSKEPSSQFYLPLAAGGKSIRRKRVQFLVENEQNSENCVDPTQVAQVESSSVNQVVTCADSRVMTTDTSNSGAEDHFDYADDDDDGRLTMPTGESCGSVCQREQNNVKATTTDLEVNTKTNITSSVPQANVTAATATNTTTITFRHSNNDDDSQGEKSSLCYSTASATVHPLRRSLSDRLHENGQDRNVVFHDTMALRTRQRNHKISLEDLARLDGVTLNTPSTCCCSLKNAADTEKIPKAVQTSPDEFKSTTIHQEHLQQTSTLQSLVKAPPSVPPRRRPSTKTVFTSIDTTNVVKLHTKECETSPNKTVVQITANSNTSLLQTCSAVHKLQIKNQPQSLTDEFVHNVNVKGDCHASPQRKTSILINGDDCYSTVNVNDDVPLYQSSVVVKDSSPTVVLNHVGGSSTIYIGMDTQQSSNNCNGSNKEMDQSRDEHLLRDPVEAVKRNLVPHVCGKSTISIDGDGIADDCSDDNSMSTPYETMDTGSETYTDHSNRSSVTEDDLNNSRNKFYELLADATLIEVADSDDHHYESIKNHIRDNNGHNNDPIYEEIEIPPPLPTNPPPSSLVDDLHLDKEYTTRSIFEGASKYDILSYLVDAKERVIDPAYSYGYTTNANPSMVTGTRSSPPMSNRTSHLSTVSDSSEENSLIISPLLLGSDSNAKCADIERTDSGVGSETSKSSLSKYRLKASPQTICEDCELSMDTPISPSDTLICRKCVKRRTERKEIITEIVETEEKYSRDLQIILEEFYQPMLVAGLLTPDQLSAIFLNVEELLENSQGLAERLRDAVEIATEQGDEDLLTVNMGKLFLEAAPMLHAFETYCVRQGAASLLLASLEKDKELLGIFLRVSQMENTMLRRMNLNSFLMVPVQRVTKYPLLLSRLYNVTPNHHVDGRRQLHEAQTKIELHLNHMNNETRDVPTKLWRRIGSATLQNNQRNGSTASNELVDLVSIKLRKIAVDVLEWNHDDAKFALEGRLLYTQPTDNNWRKGRTIKLAPVNAMLVIHGKMPAMPPEDTALVFAKHSSAREAALLLVRDKNGRYSLLREPLFLDRCIIAADPSWQSYFEVQEILGKDTFIFKAEDDEQTKLWYSQLQFHAQGMGAWRKRRNALANIMINGMGLRT